MIRRPPRSPLFPYTTLSRSQRRRALLARADLLSGQLRLLARGDDRRPAVWAGHARALRCAGRRRCSLAMTTLGYVPADAGALSLGAGEVARSIVEEAARRRAAVQVVRNGSRGAYLVPPLIEVLTPRRRPAFGPVTTAARAPPFHPDFLNGRS